jgi:hypothetical protein
MKSMLGMGAGAWLAGQVMPMGFSWAEDDKPVAVELPPAPAGFDLSHEYYKDASQMLQHMK